MVSPYSISYLTAKQANVHCQCVFFFRIFKKLSGESFFRICFRSFRFFMTFKDETGGCQFDPACLLWVAGHPFAPQQAVS